jgi:carboxymethylenebutenolidase
MRLALPLALLSLSLASCSGGGARVKASSSTAATASASASTTPQAVTAAAAPATATAPAAASGLSPTPMDLPPGITEAEFKTMHSAPHEPGATPKGIVVDLDDTPAYLSLPAGQGPFPGVLVIHEWWGLNDNVRLWADRLAADGYAALAVDLYGGKVATTPDEALALMDAVDEKAALDTLLEGHRFLKEDPRIRAPKRASIGWCFGGGWSLHLAMNAPDLDACVMYYGRLVTDVEQLRSIRAPLLGVFGNRDTSIPPKDVDAFDAALTAAGVEHRILRYDADHAFANPSAQGRYDEPSAAAAWAEARAFLAAELR